MAEQFFPGFEDDEPKKKDAKPAAPAAAPAKAFDPFAGQSVQPPSLVAPPPAEAAKPVPGPATKPPVAKAPVPTPAQPDLGEDKDIKPGSGKDLWACPHCGAGNKPGRPECRVCGKKPSDPVVTPWQRNPLVLGGIAAGVVALIVAIVVLGKADLSLRDPGTVDGKPRIGGSAEGRAELSGGVVLELKKRIAVSGRIAGLANGPGKMTVVALALGKAAAEVEPVKPVAGESYSQGCILICTFSGKAELKDGQWLSLTVATGDLVKEGAFLKEAEGFIPVQVDAYRVKE